MGYTHTTVRLLQLLLLAGAIDATKRPHIVFIVADDVGWNDIGFHNSDIKSPTIDRLARAGVILNQSYVQPQCTPSRTAFLTGYYPFRTGLQHLYIQTQQPSCIPDKFTLLPQRLKDLQYSTHIVGKWHLGFCKWECTPTYRGFDSFYGFYSGSADHYTHKTAGYLDLRNNTDPDRSQNGKYSTFLFRDEAVRVIKNHDPTKSPLFLYLAFQSVHSPLQVPTEYHNMYPKVRTDSRKTFSGMITAMDDAIKNVEDALKEKKMLDDTIIVFTSDNGGSATAGGNNYPLRGAKATVYEGGTRAVSFINSKLIKKDPYTFEGLMHAVDWLPTLVAAAGGGNLDLGDIDGYNLWPAIRDGGASSRSDVVYVIDDHSKPIAGYRAIRDYEYKLILGYPGRFSSWNQPPGIYGKGKGRTFETDHNEIPTLSERHSIREEGLTTANRRKYLNMIQLFNLKDDPLEKYDISSQLPTVVEKLKKQLAAYEKKAVPVNYPPLSQSSGPKNFDRVWSPGWC